ncbi:DNase I-like protein [Metschnikowia bicuspidata var. bicuspidata NRRL YB-4993]|uniref:DNA-(apurinic or apyrimidinic site) endonuclease 2 n=1 Tax=Metschnikowia bicuspidata var. bicuspidata NRRL YB-4993 TaxID=869754 RepID=A0A1A0HL49_9ASCO|nr:DNase I-like protein [Metschnikowia bicuspidata var. bicuspidata NRRL YB-4993]OBA24538.1 DNase I-like protein [Metschnikowia bicuspidata var. bicuspidata NRRL YB-4993]
MDLHAQIRYFSFNVNGAKTLFNYHPWNQLQGNFNAFLRAVDADIISLQELKIQLDTVTQFGLNKDYRSFILIPKFKKGYSGVGLYVRLPQQDESPQVQQALTVVGAEEGITGRLKDKIEGVPYMNLPKEQSIGGYLLAEDIAQLELTEQDMLNLDSEGRCVIAELANNTIVVSLYCPANSMGTPEGQSFRLNFLEVMFRRCANLEALGKKVVVMGDINVSPDLIDSAETINELIKKKAVVNNLIEGGSEFEMVNREACLSFHSSTLHRSLLHKYIFPSLEGAPNCKTQFLFDTTRVVKKRELALYTVWNTMTNSRQSNFGSRIDLILISSEEDLRQIKRAELLSFLHGSDHCPILTDLCVAHQELHPIKRVNNLSFEAKKFYNLVRHRDISTLFSTAAIKRSSDSKFLDTSDTSEAEIMNKSEFQTHAKKKKPPASKKLYSGRKAATSNMSQQPIQNFFFQVRPDNLRHAPQDPGPQETKPLEIKKSEAVDVISQFANLVYDNPPLCHHNEKCILKTSKTQFSRGKKFWCCARASKGSIELGDHRCNFFEWTKKPTDSLN